MFVAAVVLLLGQLFSVALALPDPCVLSRYQATLPNERTWGTVLDVSHDNTFSPAEVRAYARRCWASVAAQNFAFGPGQNDWQNPNN